MSCDMEKTMSSVDSLPATPASEVPVLTVSPADTSLNSADVKTQEVKPEEKKPAKKRKSWGQELPVPKTNLPPRKRAKTEDEKEQRRIERVLRNRAAAQTSRERKRLEMEKLENEKIQMEQQNQFLLQRLSQMEAENNRLSQQLAQLAAEVRGSRANTPMPGSPATASPTLTPTLFKQERDELPLERIPFPTPSLSDYSPTLKPSTLAESSDVAQHPAVSVAGLEGDGSALPLFDLGSDLKHHSTDDVAAPLSDDDFNRLFHGDSSVEPDSSVFEDGLAFDVLEGGDLSAFPFDSMVNFDSEPVTLEGIEMAHGLPDETTCKTSSVQPGFGASTTRCDGQGIAAGC
ncbi:transcriptional activator hacA [Aspergillus flavus]|uniref:Transcriptional activator hacA n=2 Tax=Aspergillus subgen. Circumdati TaxID=2720871 RepID=HAC1_ASPOR|nr:RecName: Full=Transcriptional activator hacA [Aspergillus oryzae RIB40]QRD84349.1 transcriptional activator hacA [Aspergillus flavus]BAE93063.1 transcription factor HacA [Aspergillus oryzae]